MIPNTIWPIGMTQSQKITTTVVSNGIPANPLVKRTTEWLGNHENRRIDTPNETPKVANPPIKSFWRSSTNMDLLDPTLDETTRAPISALGARQ